MDMVKLGGEWHVPEIEETYMGDLFMDEKKGVVQLVLYKTLDENNPMGDFPLWGNISLIYGELIDGAKVVLYGCESGKRHTHVGRRATLNVDVQYAFWGLEANTQTELLFNEFRVDFGDIVEWAGLCRYERTKDDFALKWTSDPEVEIVLEGRTIRVLTGNSEPFGEVRGQKAELKQRVVFSIKPNEKWTIERFMDDAYCVRSLITLGLQEKVFIDELKYFHEQHTMELETKDGVIKEIQDATVYTRLKKEKTGNPHPFEYLFSFKELLGETYYVKNWFTNYPRLKPIIDLCESAYLNSDTPSEVFFLSMTQALETYHSRFVCNNPREYSSFIEQSVQDIYETLACDNARYAMQFLYTEYQEQHRSHITLNTRLRYLLFMNDSCYLYTLGYSKEDFIEKVVTSRNYYTHYDERKANDAFAREELPRANRVLWDVARYYILKEIGFSQEVRNEKLRKEQRKLEDYDSIREMGHVVKKR